MRWGLSRAQRGAIDDQPPRPVQHLFVLIEAELHQQVQHAAGAAGVEVSPWLRHRLRQITREDFPASWQVAQEDVPTIDPSGRAAPRSHDSRHYGTRFMLRLDRASHTKLQRLVKRFQTSRAEIVRQLIAQAGPEDFPERWHLAVNERRQRTRRRER
jgi:predicted HicB family RNase H-like nuclease